MKSVLFDKYDYISTTESDVVVENGSIEEAISILNENDEIPVSYIQLNCDLEKYKKLPISSWVPKPVKYKTFYTGITGFQFITFRKDILYDFLNRLENKEIIAPIALGCSDYYGISDTNLGIYIDNILRQKSGITNRKLDHIGWEKYMDINGNLVESGDYSLEKKKHVYRTRSNKILDNIEQYKINDITRCVEMEGIDYLSDNPGYGENINVVQAARPINTKYGSCTTQCEDESISLMQSFIKNISGGKFVEIGVFGGSSLLRNYDLCISNNIDVYGIDPFEDINIFNGRDASLTVKHIRDVSRKLALDRRLNLEKNISQHNLNINLIKNTKNKSFKLFNDNSISVLHLDGDHSYIGVKNDLNNYWSKMKSGGIIINDDYEWTCCKKAIDEFIKIKNSEILKSYPSEVFNKHFVRIIIKK